MHKTLKNILGRYRDLLDYKRVVKPQLVIYLKPKPSLKETQWKAITRKIDANHGCWDPVGKQWILPNITNPMNLPPSKKKPSSRLYIHDKVLLNLLFLRDVFKDNRIESWKDIKEALSVFRPERREYSKSTCRDYLGALLALQPRSAQT